MDKGVKKNMGCHCHGMRIGQAIHRQTLKSLDCRVKFRKKNQDLKTVSELCRKILDIDIGKDFALFNACIIRKN